MLEIIASLLIQSVDIDEHADPYWAGDVYCAELLGGIDAIQEQEADAKVRRDGEEWGDGSGYF